MISSSEKSYHFDWTLNNLSFGVTLSIRSTFPGGFHINFEEFKCKSRRKELHILPPDLLTDLRKSLQFFKLWFLHRTFKVLIYHCFCFKANAFVLQERVACYAHFWHLTTAALHLSLLIAEPSLTLPLPASFDRLKKPIYIS